MYIKRAITKYIENVATKNAVVVLTGARQVGKTTLLRKIFPKMNYVTLDDTEALTLAKTDSKAFFLKYEYPIIVDEFQYAPDLLYEIKKIVDEKKFKAIEDESVRWQGLFFLTGSQKFETMKGIKESLAGRVAIVELFGLSQQEIEKREFEIFDVCDFKVNESYENFEKNNVFEKILNGGYPEIFLENHKTRQEFFNDYIKTYINRDIKGNINIADEVKFIKFLRNLAARTAQELNLEDICDGIGITSVTGNKWLSILVATNIIYLLPAYYSNTIKRLIKRPKIHFMDTGLCAYLAGYFDVDIIENSGINGAIFETFVVSEIIKNFVNNGINIYEKLFYFRDNSRKEIDLLIKDGDNMYPIEIKKAYTPSNTVFANFDYIKTKINNIVNGYIICNRDDVSMLKSDIKLIPVSLI